MKKPSLSMKEIREVFIQRYDYEVNMQSLDNAADVLQGKFVSKDDEYKRFCRIDILKEDNNNIFHRTNNFTTRLQNEEFKKQIDDIIEVGLKRYHDKYQSSLKNESPFVLYEKYSRRDVSLLMNCGRDLSSTMYGMKRIDDDVFMVDFCGWNPAVLSEFYLLRGFFRDCIVILLSLNITDCFIIIYYAGSQFNTFFV